MNLEELCKKYGVSESSVSTNFKRTQAAIKKRTGILIEKSGRGKNAVYEEIVPDNRAITMYEETKDNFVIDRNALSYENVEFNCFLAVVLTQFMVFRGTYIDLVRYMNLKVDERNIQTIKEAMNSLADKGIISLYYDISTTEGYFTASLLRKAEVEMKIGIDMVRTCKKIADENNKRDYIPLLKTWLGMQVMSEEQPFTMSQLEALTGLSEYQVRESKKLLEANDLFKTTKAYKAGCLCLGQNVDLNAYIPH